MFRKKVLVEISADVDAKNEGPNTSNPAGMLIGKLVNIGKATEAMYGLEPGPYQYLLYVFPAAGANGRWVLERVDNAPPHNHHTVAEGPQVGCNHDQAWPSSFAEFRSCADGPPPPRMRATRTDDLRHPAVHIAGMGLFSFFNAVQVPGLSGEDPAWFTCTAGCCVADAPQLF